MSEVVEKLAQIERAFDEMKSKQDTVIAEEIKKGTADVVRKEEVDRISAAISALEADVKSIEKKANRPGAEFNDDRPEVAEHKAAFNAFMRKGRDDGLADLEAKALNVTTSADGGYAVPEQIDRSILDLIQLSSPIRQYASVISVGGADYKKLVNIHGAATGWVGETSTRPETNTPQLTELVPSMGEIYANPAVTQRALDDVFFNVEGWLSDEVAQQFAIAEGSAFVSGDGTNKPKGFLAGTINTSTDGARTFGHVEMIKTAVAGGFKTTTTSSNPGDSFIDVIHAMKSPIRSGAVWFMNTLTLAQVRKFRDVDGNYIWRPGLAEGQPATILGYAVAEIADMGGVATDTYPIAFGNWKRAFTIVDRMGTRVLRDPYTNKPYVHFYTTKRVGSFLADSNALKVLATRT